jgi:hypothetical protein
MYVARYLVVSLRSHTQSVRDHVLFNLWRHPENRSDFCLHHAQMKDRVPVFMHSDDQFEKFRGESQISAR